MQQITQIARAAQSSLTNFVSPQDREEQGYFPNGERGPRVNKNSNTPLTIITTDNNALIPQNDKLLAFRSLTGIDTVPALSNSGHALRAAPNVGIYQRVVLAEKKAARSYRLFHIAINFCLGAQIIVGASVTALGAASGCGSRHSVTAFGAMNTIMAGILTYLKGSGLPDRFKTHENEWRQIREYIEQRERELCLADCPLNPHEEVAIVEEMYNRVKAEVDSGNKTAGGRGQLQRHDSIIPTSHRAATKAAKSATETPVTEKS